MKITRAERLCQFTRRNCLYGAEINANNDLDSTR